VPIEDPVSVTLTQGQFTLLHKARIFERCRVTITATTNPDVGGVLFRTTRRSGKLVEEVVGLEVFLRVFQTFPGAKIEASTPAGVASLDVTYVVRTGNDT
jgi:hypothetical protein